MYRIFLFQDNLDGEKQNILYNGLITNPRVIISEDIEACDYIILDFRDLEQKKEYKYPEKTIIIDFRDSTDIYQNKCLMYFKRSMVYKPALSTIHYHRKIVPISYCIKLETLAFSNVGYYDRDIDISIFFEPGNNSYRGRIATMIKERFSQYKIHVGVVGADGKTGRNSIQEEYYDKMFHSKIVVTCNPDNWEGDYRLFEALTSGALVMCDKMITPVIHPFLHGEHLIYYDRDHLEDLSDKITCLLENPEVRIQIANQGLNYVYEHHKPSDRIDEILSFL